MSGICVGFVCFCWRDSPESASFLFWRGRQGRSGDFFQKFRGVREKQEVFLGGFFIRRSLVSPLDCSWRRLGALIISLKQSVTPWLGVGDCFGKLVRPQPTLFARFFSLPLCLDGYMTVVSGNTVFGPTHSDR